jgi:signal peptidase I
MATRRGQIENRNYLSSTGFTFILNRSPKTAFYANKAVVPGITLGVANHSNYLTNPIPVPGDNMVFEDFELDFIVDEDLTNFMEIQNWMRGLGFPESLAQIYDYQSDADNYVVNQGGEMNLYSDGTLFILNSNLNLNYQVVFRRMFPYRLSELQFDATNTDEAYFTATVSFKYMMYNITDKEGRHLPRRYS